MELDSRLQTKAILDDKTQCNTKNTIQRFYRGLRSEHARKKLVLVAALSFVIEFIFVTFISIQSHNIFTCVLIDPWKLCSYS